MGRAQGLMWVYAGQVYANMLGGCKPSYAIGQGCRIRTIWTRQLASE